MLAGFLLQPGHSQTLPEQLTAETVMSFIEANNIETADELIESLPPLHKRHVSLVFESQALNKELVSREHPRVVAWGADARFILSWASNPEAPDNVEFLKPLADRWDAGVIDFSGDEPELSRPDVCSSCHGEMKRPIWGDYDFWRGTNDDKHLEQSEWSQILSDLEASDNPRISPLELFEQRTGLHAATSSATGNTGIVPAFANEFNSMLSLRHAEILFNRLKKRDNYAELAERAVCGEIRQVINLFHRKDHYLALMHDGDQLIEVQARPDDLFPRGRFGSGNANVEHSLQFLILHDFWSKDSRVSNFYSSVGNEQVSPRFFVYLNYLPGTATAEQELRASYKQHFVLTGQSSLDARIDREPRRSFPAPSTGYSIRKTAVFGEGHFNYMAPRVCNIVRQAPNQPLSQLRITDGKAGEAAGEIAFSVTLDPVRSDPASVDWFTTERRLLNALGTRRAGARHNVDYVYDQGTLTFNAGESRKSITVEIIADDEAEPPEFFSVHLGQQSSPNALIVDGLALATIEGELPPVQTRLLTAGFENAPVSHDGLAAFTVQMRFSEEVILDGPVIADGLLTINGGTLGPALRVADGSNTAWELSVTPSGEGDVVITLPGNQECDEQLTACTADARSLEQAATVTIPWSSLPPTSAAPSTPTEPPTSVTPPSDDPTGETDDMTAPAPVDESDDESTETGEVGGVDEDSSSGSVTPPAVVATWGERLPGRDIELPTGSNPTGLWSDGETLWVISNWSTGEVTTYSLADGSALGVGEVMLSNGTSASHRFQLQGGGGFPAGLWSDGETLWVTDILARKVFAYRLSDGGRQSAQDIPAAVLAAAGNTMPTGLWSDGTTLWVADILVGKAFAYRLSDKVWMADKEFDLWAADGRTLQLPWGLWSDGETALATLYYQGGVAGYALSGGAYQADRGLGATATGQYPMGLWSDHETLWVVTAQDRRIRAYAVPGLRPAAAPDASSLADPFRVRVVTRVDALQGADAGPPVFIADEALHGAIAGALGLGPEEAVGMNAMERIRSLNLRGAGIVDLTGLEYAVNLQALDLGLNPIRDPWMLSLLPRLTVLNLDGAVSDLSSLPGLVALERLSLRNNGLTDTSALAGLVNLRHLSLRGNALSDIWPLAGLVQLEILDLRGNPLRNQAPLSGLYKLRHVDLARP